MEPKMEGPLAKIPLGKQTVSKAKYFTTKTGHICCAGCFSKSILTGVDGSSANGGIIVCFVTRPRL